MFVVGKFSMIEKACVTKQPNKFIFGIIRQRLHVMAVLEVSVKAPTVVLPFHSDF
jgi:hypothetical protein